MRSLELRIAQIESKNGNALPWHTPLANWTAPQLDAVGQPDVLRSLSIGQLDWLIENLSSFVSMHREGPPGLPNKEPEQGIAAS